ncbi:PAS domain S-box protein [Paenibacillus sp. FSL K6-0276]|uniref:sensor histidine kinase n=1 Tax=Paenibacillus sp. FSL K6-0276 TaxID=2921450 RepID=UPI0030EB8238
MHSLGDENVITWSMDREENLLTMSNVLEEWVGCTSKAIPHSPDFLRELVYVVDLNRYDAYMERLNAGHISSLEYRMQGPTEGLKWVQSIGTPTLNKENKVCRIDGVMLDITEQKTVQIQLESTFSLYQQMFSNLDVAIWSYDYVAKKVLFISDAVLNITGYSVEQAKEDDFWFRIAHKEEDPLIQEILSTARQGIPKLSEYQIIHASGEPRWIQVRIIPSLDESQAVVRLDGILADITERKLMDITSTVDVENKLVQREAEYKLIINNMKDMMGVLDQKGNFIVASPSCETLIGIPVGLIKDTTILEYIDPDEQEILREQISNIFRTKASKMFYNRFIHSKGYILNLECLATPVLSEDGEVVSIVIVARDITKRVQMERELRESEEFNQQLIEVTASSILYKGKVACISIFRDISDRKKADEDRQHAEQIIRESEERYFRLQMSLDQFSHDLFGVMKISHMEQRLIREVRDILQVTNINLIEVESNYDKLCEIIETEQGYSLKIGEFRGKSYLLSINEKTSSLEISSIRVWLETITRYVSVLFDHFLLIEDLIKDLELAASKQVAPTWLLRFMFNLSENERKRLAQDLHDSALQEQIIWYRKLDLLLGNKSINEELREQLEQVAEGLLDVIYQLRIICNELRPPALVNEGLISSLETLFEFTQLRTNYQIYFESEAFTHKLDDEVLIGLYRIVQELLANAAKHSFATEVYITLASEGKQIHLNYEDNGIGMSLLGENSLESMGIYGMKERVRSMDGTIAFHSPEKKGLAVNISIPAD